MGHSDSDSDAEPTQQKLKYIIMKLTSPANVILKHFHNLT